MFLVLAIVIYAVSETIDNFPGYNNPFNLSAEENTNYSYSIFTDAKSYNNVTYSFLSNYFCSQNIPNQTTDCGGVATGNYIFSGDWIDSNQIFDGNWDTNTKHGGGSTAQLYINYSFPTVPFNQNETKLVIGFYDAPTYSNYTYDIPSYCYAFDDHLAFQIFSSYGSQTGLRCLNNAGVFQDILAIQYYYISEIEIDWIDRKACSQNLANQSTACGGTGAGNYSVDGTWTTPWRIYDGKWNTYGYDTIRDGTGFLFVNYSYPEKTFDRKHTKFFVEYYYGALAEYRNYSFSIPMPCWNTYSDHIAFRFPNYPDEYRIECMAGSSWTNISTSPYYAIGEMQMNWYFLPEVDIYTGDSFAKSITLNDHNETFIGITDEVNTALSSHPSYTDQTFNFDIDSTVQLRIVNISYGFNIDDCSSYTYKIFNVTYYDQYSKSIISLTDGYDLTFTDGTLTETKSGIFTGNTNDQFCTDVDPSDAQLDLYIYGTFTLSKTDYATKLYKYTEENPLYGNNSHAYNTSFYLIRLNESETIVFTWLKEDYTAIDGIMEIYECNGDGTRTLIESQPIINGEATANLQLLTQSYSYEVIIDGVRYTDENSFTQCHVESQTTRQFIVSVSGSEISEDTGMYFIPCIVNKTANDTVMLTWGLNPNNDALITGCVYAYRHSVVGTQLIYTSCSNSSPITRTIPASGYDYSVQGKLFQSGKSISCKDIVEFKTIVPAAKTFGAVGVLAMFFMIATLVLIWSDSSNDQLLAAIVGVILSFIFGFMAFGWQTTISLVFFIIIIMLVARHSRKQE